ncbi:MAG: nitronate monooxygenase, partial [Gammaproteobacteria bacterium]|nr:nitronate monooxygenase [Gammaproteobacteria bacterium]
FNNEEKRGNAWRDIWSAGQGVGSVESVLTTAELVAELEDGYREAITRLNNN